MGMIDFLKEVSEVLELIVGKSEIQEKSDDTNIRELNKDRVAPPIPPPRLFNKNGNEIRSDLKT